jgi:Protein of unknown function (DUF1573)
MSVSIAILTSLVLSGAPFAAVPTAGGPASAVSQAAPATFLRFAPASFDLGELIAGKPKTATLTVTNITKGPITVERIKGACGCTTISAPPTGPVAAGSSFTVDITIDPGTKTGVDLVKAVHFMLDGNRTQSMNVLGHVKTVVHVSPDVVDASRVPAGADAVVTLETLDKTDFSVTAIEPANVVDRPQGKSAQQKLTIDFARWEAAGRPAKLTVSTDKADAETLVIPIKAAPAVVLYRLPAAAPSSPDRETIEVAQDAIIHAIDARIADSERSTAFRMRLHRETGMLFLHGTQADVSKVREAVKELPESAGIREATH